MNSFSPPPARGGAVFLLSCAVALCLAGCQTPNEQFAANVKTAVKAMQDTGVTGRMRVKFPSNISFAFGPALVISSDGDIEAEVDFDSTKGKLLETATEPAVHP